MPGARPEPVPTAESLPFWQGAREGALILRQCLRCETIAAPAAPRCPRCLAPDLSPFRCSGRAALHGRTVLHLDAVPGHEPPLTIVECAVEEAPHILLIALDEDDGTVSLRPGDPLRISFRPDPNGWSYAAVEGAEQ